MRSHIFLWPLCMVMSIAAFENARAQDVLDEHLEPLRPFLGKTWKGELSNSTSERPVFDVARWERALNGRAVRILHSINDGEYGGESIVVWDREKETLVYFYFTTAGFYTSGTMMFEDGEIVGHEYVTGGDGGITEVKAVMKVLPDGRLHSKSQYFKDGEWVDGHEVCYDEDPTARVVFR